MFWEDKPEEKSIELSDEVTDLHFQLNCKALPLDHAWALSSALMDAAPWIRKNPQTAVHLIHGAESGNGWIRPENTQNELLYLSRRTRFVLRLHRDNLALAAELVNIELDIEGHPLRIGNFKQQPLLPQTTIFSRYVVTEPDMDEEAFLTQVAPLIQAQGVRIRKMMGGLMHTFITPHGPITTRSLMLSDLEKEESIRLQQNGIGDQQLMGMGIFLPHKGIAPVADLNEEVPQT